MVGGFTALCPAKVGLILLQGCMLTVYTIPIASLILQGFQRGCLLVAVESVKNAHTVAFCWCLPGPCHTRLPTSLFDAFSVIMRVSRQWLWLPVIYLYPEQYACTSVRVL